MKSLRMTDAQHEAWKAKQARAYADQRAAIFGGAEVTDIVRIGDATLYHGDCLEIMPTLHFRCNCAAWNESECLCGAWGSGSGIDVVTDPPA